MDNTQAYLSQFSIVLLFIIGGILFLTVTLLASKILRPHRPNAEKLSTYESGEQAVASAWPQFNIRFYVVAILFLLFEVELIFLFPLYACVRNLHPEFDLPIWEFYDNDFVRPFVEAVRAPEI